MKDLKNDFVIVGLSLVLAVISVGAAIIATMFSSKPIVTITVAIIAVISLVICCLAFFQLKKSVGQSDDDDKGNKE